MTIKEHQYWVSQWLKLARAAVEKRDWLYASNCYKSVAHHSAVLAALRSKKRKAKP